TSVRYAWPSCAADSRRSAELAPSEPHLGSSPTPIPRSRRYEPRSRSRSQGSDVRVLIADDEPTTRLVVKAVVQKLGHECLLATDADRAWELLQSTPVDVLITDWMMPGLD